MRRAKNEEREASDRLGLADQRGADVIAAPVRRAPRRAARVVETAKQLWSAPTRRHFLGLVLAAGAVSVAGDALQAPGEPRSTWSGRTRWIGHC